MKKIFLASFLTFFVISFTGCNIPSKALPTITQDQVKTGIANQLTENAIKTEVAPKTSTASPLPSATQKPTATFTPIATPSPAAPKVDFTGHQVWFAYLEGEKLQLSITVPKGIKGDYSVIVDGKQYTCFSYTMKRLDRLICLGPGLRSNTLYKLQVFAKGNDTAILERMVTIPPTP